MKRILIGLVKAYRKWISPRKQQRGCCRFTPTCSGYALEALERFGAVRGTLMTIARILRCNPFSAGGYDPVPERFSLRRSREKWALPPSTEREENPENDQGKERSAQADQEQNEED